MAAAYRICAFAVHDILTVFSDLDHSGGFTTE